MKNISPLALLISLVAASPHALAGTAYVSFLPDAQDQYPGSPATSEWDHSQEGGSANSNGYDGNYSSGTSSVAGVSVSFSSTYAGTATTHNLDKNLSTSADNAGDGFIMGNSSVSVDHQTTTIEGVKQIENYQVWTITFSEAVDNFSWSILDIDSSDEGSAKNWIDTLAAEGWSSQSLNPTLGTGDVLANWNLGGSELMLDTSTYNLDTVYRDTDTHGWDNEGSSTAEAADATATLYFASPVERISLYFFDHSDLTPTNNTPNHAVAAEGSFTFETSFTPVPEPSSISLIALAGISTLLRRRR